jgi:hypothetical protein
MYLKDEIADGILLAPLLSPSLFYPLEEKTKTK